MGIIISTIEIYFFIYTVLKLFNNYSKGRFIFTLALTNYYILGLPKTIYFILLFTLLTYEYCIPSVAGAVYFKIKDTPKIKALKNILEMRYFRLSSHIILVCGDFVIHVLQEMGYALLDKLHLHIPSKSTPSAYQPLMPAAGKEEDEAKVLNEQLNNLLKYGTAILTDSVKDKEAQRKNAIRFMNDVGKFFNGAGKKTQ